MAASADQVLAGIQPDSPSNEARGESKNNAFRRASMNTSRRTSVSFDGEAELYNSENTILNEQADRKALAAASKQACHGSNGFGEAAEAQGKLGIQVQMKATVISVVTAKRIMARNESAKSLASVGSNNDITLLREQSQEQKNDVVDRLLLDIKVKLNEVRMRTIDLFRDIDKSGDGQISTEEFLDALKGLFKVELGKNEADLLLARLDRDKSGDIDVKELDRGLKAAEKRGRNRRLAAGRGGEVITAGVFETGEEDLIGLVEVLKAQTAALKRKKAREDYESDHNDFLRDTENRSRFVAERVENGRFVGGAPWRRPCCSSGEFLNAGNLPAVYLGPVEASRAGRPCKNYEHSEVPFGYANIFPKMFGEPGMLARHGVPLLHGDSRIGAGPEMEMSPRPFGVTAQPQRTPRSARQLAGVVSSKASATWKTSVSCFRPTGSFLPRLEERHPTHLLSARTETGRRQLGAHATTLPLSAR